MQEKFLERIKQLLEKAEKVKATHKSDFRGASTYDEAIFVEWKSNVENLILLVAGKDSVYYKNFIEYTSDIDSVDRGIGVLRALKEDLEKGFLTSVRDLVIAEVFTDFLDMAEHLLEKGYKDPAASLIGAVLEDGLRKIAQKHNVTVKHNDDISSLNTRLANKEIYTRLIQKQIQVWKDIRNSADHGKFNEYNSDQVRLMLEGVRKFLAEYL
jgi:hypothetical protein